MVVATVVVLVLNDFQEALAEIEAIGGADVERIFQAAAQL